MKNNVTDFAAIADKIDENTAALFISQPNFFGFLEDVEIGVELIHKVGGKMIVGVDPVAQALLKTPAELGVDVVVGEGQPFGVPISFGGPLVGFFAVKKELIRFMPGRIASRTTDVDGKEGFVLTLQTREQHIRREKATSNICTNQALCATAVTIYLSLLGKQGYKQVALLSAEKAQEAFNKITALDGFEAYADQSFVREFAIKTPVPAKQIITELAKNKLLAGIDAGRWFKGCDDCLIIACTEKRTTQEIDRLTESLKELSKSGILSSL